MQDASSGNKKKSGDKEEDVRSYWMTLRTEEDTLIWRRKLWIAICGGIVLEKTLNLSSDRLLDDDDNDSNMDFDDWSEIRWDDKYDIQL